MELQVSKWCFECGYQEVLWQVPINNFVSVNLMAKTNLTCRWCHEQTIRLDSKVVDVPTTVDSTSSV